jgi:hypothetical protein
MEVRISRKSQLSSTTRIFVGMASSLSLDCPAILRASVNAVPKSIVGRGFFTPGPTTIEQISGQMSSIVMVYHILKRSFLIFNRFSQHMYCYSRVRSAHFDAI